MLKSLRCDLFLGAHGSYFDLEAKYPRWKDGATTVFIDPVGCRKYIESREQAFRAELARQQASR